MASGGTHVTNAFTYLRDRDYDKIFFDENKRTPVEMRQLFKGVSTTDPYIQEAELIGLKGLSQMDEGEAFPHEKITEANDKKITYDLYGLGAEITEVMMEDDVYGKLKGIPAELGRAGAYSQDSIAWTILNEGFTAGTELDINDEILFTTHTAQGSDGSDISNASTSSLSVSSLQSALNHFENMKNEQGVPTPMRDNLVLIIPPALRYKADELMMSEYDPESANNAKNTLKNEPVTYMVCHFLTSDTAWFLANKSKHDLRFITRRGLKPRTSISPYTGNKLYATSARWKATFVHWRGVYGSSGA